MTNVNGLKQKLLQNIKDEIYTEENREIIQEFFETYDRNILNEMYPYFMWMGLFFFQCSYLS